MMMQGVGDTDYSNNQKWMIRIIYVPFPVLILGLISRKLLSGSKWMTLCPQSSTDFTRTCKIISGSGNQG